MLENLNAAMDDRETSNDETPNPMEEEEHAIDSIINHGKKGEKWTYLVLWYGRDSSEDSWEPLSKLPRNKIVVYHKRESISLLDNVDQAMIG